MGSVIRSRSASASRVPCRNSMGTTTSNRWAAAFVRRPARGGLSGKPRNARPLHARQRECGLRLRGHAPAERFPASDKRQTGSEPAGRGHRGTNGGMDEVGPVRPPQAHFHERELIAQRGDPPFLETSAIFCRNGWVMPAPAPCANTKQARAPSGRRHRPEMECCSLMTSLRGSGSAFTRVTPCPSARLDRQPRRGAFASDHAEQ